MLYFEEEEKKKMKKQKIEVLMDSLKFQNFKSFLPLPNHKMGNKGGFAPIENEMIKSFLYFNESLI